MFTLYCALKYVNYSYNVLRFLTTKRPQTRVKLIMVFFYFGTHKKIDYKI